MAPSLEHGVDEGSGNAKNRRIRYKRENRIPEMALRVLVVEDSVDDALLVALELERGGYETYWERVETPEAMREALDGKHWDLVIADHAMPRFSAPAALQILQEKGLDLPFIIVSREIGEETAVAAMRAGAHDYIMKGNLARLCPAVSRELREAEERRERRQSVTSLRQSEELYRAVVEQSSECIFLVDARSKRIIEANYAFRKLLGYTPEELRGMTLYDFVAHDRASVNENSQLILEEGRYNIGERRYRRKDGALVDVEVRANALLLDGREVMCCVSHDVTERKLAEQRRDTQYTVSRVLAESGSLEEATPKLLEAIGVGLGWELGMLWMVDRSVGALRCEEVWRAPSTVAARFEDASWETSFAPGRGLPGRVWESNEALWIPNVLQDTSFSRLESAASEGLRAAFAFPIQDKGRVLGIIEFFNHEILPPDMDLLQTVAVMGTQIGQFIERKRGEEALRESEERYRVVAETASDAIVMADEDSRILFVNGAAQEIFGYDAEEMLGEQLTMLMPERPQHLHQEGLKRYVETGRQRLDREAVELSGLHKSGKEIPLEISFGEYTKEGRRFFTGFVRDITERKEAEEALREAEEKYRSIFENSLEGIFQATLDGRLLLTANPALAHMFGYESPEEMLADVSDIRRQLYVDTGEEELFARRMRERGAVSGFEFQARRRDGVEIWISVNAHVVYDKGEPAFLEGMVEDITERKMAEEALTTRARQQSAVAGLGRRALAKPDLWALMDEAVALVARTLDADYCKILELLPEGDELLLRSGVGWREGLVGHATVGQDSQVGYVLSSDNPVIVDDLRTETRFRGTALLHDHGVVSGMSVIVHGPERPFGVLSVHTREKRTFTQDDVNFLRAVANVISVAVERQRAEERLNEIKELERRRIAADLHDVVLQDLMFGLLETQLMQMAARSSDGKEPNLDSLENSLETISEALQRSVEGLREAIFELRLEENLERSFVSAVEALVEMNQRMSRKRYVMHLSIEDISTRTLPTDAGRSLLRIVQEALNNARRHSGARNIRVTLKARGDEVRVEVSDDGRGFDKGSTRGGVGTSMMLERASNIGGQLDIESVPGEGTLVRFHGSADRLLRDQ